MYNGASWIEEFKLLAPKVQVSAGFGISLALANGTLVVGARGKDASSGVGIVGKDGAAYIFRGNETEWWLEAQLTASDQSPILASTSL